MKFTSDQEICGTLRSAGIAPLTLPEPRPKSRVTYEMVGEVLADTFLWLNGEGMLAKRIRVAAALEDCTIEALAHEVGIERTNNFYSALEGKEGRVIPIKIIAYKRGWDADWLMTGQAMRAGKPIVPLVIAKIMHSNVLCSGVQEDLFARGKNAAIVEACGFADLGSSLAWRQVAALPLVALNEWLSRFLEFLKEGGRDAEAEVIASSLGWWHRYFMTTIAHAERYRTTVPGHGTMKASAWDVAMKQPALSRSEREGITLHQAMRAHYTAFAQWPGEISEGIDAVGVVPTPIAKRTSRAQRN